MDSFFISLDRSFREQNLIFNFYRDYDKFGLRIFKKKLIQRFLPFSTIFNPPGTKGFGTHTKHQGGGRKGPPPVSQEREMLQT